MTIIKRDGREVSFDTNRITEAIKKAIRAVDGRLTANSKLLAENIACEIERECTEQGRVFNVEQIQDMVEDKLMSSDRKDVARAYITYRNERTREREKTSSLMKQIGEKLLATNVQNQNANLDERSFGGRMGEARSLVAKEYALTNLVSKMARKHHDNNEIYIHDLDSYAVGLHNCLTVPLDRLLAEGFTTRQTDVRPAGSVKSAMQLVAVLFQLQSLCQFGGVAASHLDWTMVPYVRKSFAKHFKVGMKFIANQPDFKISDTTRSITDPLYCNQPDVYRYAIEQTNEEVKQATEAMFHNLNVGATLQ